MRRNKNNLFAQFSGSLTLIKSFQALSTFVFCSINDDDEYAMHLYKGR